MVALSIENCFQRTIVEVSERSCDTGIPPQHIITLAIGKL